MSPDAVARKVYDAELSPEEFEARLARLRDSAEEDAELDALLCWFLSTYPTPRQRLAYARRKSREWTRRGA